MFRNHRVKAGIISALFLSLCAVLVCVGLVNTNHSDNSTENLENLGTSKVPSVLTSGGTNDISTQDVQDTTNNKNVLSVSDETNAKLQNGEVITDEKGNKFANYGGLHGDVVDTSSNILHNNADSVNANIFGSLFNAPQNDTTIYWKYDGKTLYLNSSDGPNYSSYTTTAGVPTWNEYMASAKAVEIENKISPTNISYFFTPVSGAGPGHLSKIETFEGLDKLDMSSVQNADFAFAGLAKADLTDDLGDGGLDVSSVTSAVCMFQYAAVSNTFIDNTLKNVSTNLSDSSYMFANCDYLVSIECPTLADDINAQGMFANTKNLKSSFTFPNNKTQTNNANFQYFLYGSGITEADVTSWTPVAGLNISYLFYNCENLGTIYAKPGKDWSKIAVSDSAKMFKYTQVWYTKQDKDDISMAKVSEGYFTAVIPTSWTPMQAEAKGENDPIDFYPAFSDPSQIDDYMFATYNGGKFIPIENKNISMSSISTALGNTTTLYYAKVASRGEDPLKCYTVRDLTWNYVFGDTITKGVPTGYGPLFISNYQTDKSENPNGIKTALLPSEGFGSDWDVNSTSSKVTPLVNGVKYTDFSGCYSRFWSGIYDYDWPWGCYAVDSSNVFYFTGSGWSNYGGRTWQGATVLARAFN